VRSHSQRQQVLSPTTFTQTNLISDGSSQAGSAQQTDPNLINPWGVAGLAVGGGLIAGSFIVGIRRQNRGNP